MTKELLESYRSKKAEIAELEYELAHMNDENKMIGNDTIFDYRKGYPVSRAIVGVDWEKVERMETRYRNKIDKLSKECEDVEKFVEAIEDSLTRRIFRMYYINNRTQSEIARRVHMDKSTVSRKIDDFMKVATNATNAIL